MHIVVLASRQGWHTRELSRAIESRGHTGTIVPYEGLTASVGSRPGLRSGTAELDRADAVLARIIPSGSLEQIIFRVDALHRLEERGVRVMNSPRAIERTVDKFWTSCLLEQCGIPTPDTAVCESPEEAMAAFRDLGDVIVKPLFGSMGLGMIRVADEEMAYRVFRTVETIRGVYYLQRTVDHEGRDYRVFVVDGRVLGAIERRADGWRTNIARGGQALAARLPILRTEVARRLIGATAFANAVIGASTKIQTAQLPMLSFAQSRMVRPYWISSLPGPTPIRKPEMIAAISMPVPGKDR